MKRLTLFAAIFLVAAASFAQKKRAFTIEDLYRVQNAGDLSLSPDGRTLLFTVTLSDLPHGKRTTRIWMMDADGSNLRTLTQGTNDASPHFSPGGRTIAFIRTNDGQSNLWLLPLSGGDPHPLTSISTGIADPLWSPDGKWIAFSNDVYPECGGDDACNKRIADRWSNGKLKAHMAAALLYRHSTQWKAGTRTHTFVARPRQLRYPRPRERHGGRWGAEGELTKVGLGGGDALPPVRVRPLPARHLRPPERPVARGVAEVRQHAGRAALAVVDGELEEVG